MARNLNVVRGKNGEDHQPRNVSEALGLQPDKYLDCRDLRHPWRSVGVFYAPGKNGREVHRRLVCPRCGTEATDRWTPKGGRIARTYVYPKDFKVHVGVGVKPQDVRREVMNRVTVYANEDDMVAALFQGRGRKRA